jgi:hypothetical protein
VGEDGHHERARNALDADQDDWGSLVVLGIVIPSFLAQEGDFADGDFFALVDADGLHIGVDALDLGVRIGRCVAYVELDGSALELGAGFLGGVCIIGDDFLAFFQDQFLLDFPSLGKRECNLVCHRYLFFQS